MGDLLLVKNRESIPADLLVSQNHAAFVSGVCEWGQRKSFSSRRTNKDKAGILVLKTSCCCGVLSELQDYFVEGYGREIIPI